MRRFCGQRGSYREQQRRVLDGVCLGERWNPNPNRSKVNLLARGAGQQLDSCVRKISKVLCPPLLRKSTSVRHFSLERGHQHVHDTEKAPKDWLFGGRHDSYLWQQKLMEPVLGTEFGAAAEVSTGVRPTISLPSLKMFEAGWLWIPWLPRGVPAYVLKTVLYS